VGAGYIAETHIRLLLAGTHGVGAVTICDIRLERAEALRRRLVDLAASVGVALDISSEPRVAVDGAEVVILATTASEPYLGLDVLGNARLCLNVSLDDLDAMTLLQADRLYIDDWQLIVADDHRLLGKLARQGLVTGPGVLPPQGGRAVDGTLGQLLSGECDGRRRDSELIIINPFGMSICDLAVAAVVHEAAQRHGLGTRLPL
jgi:ornithine cyclodeaminase